MSHEGNSRQEWFRRTIRSAEEKTEKQLKPLSDLVWAIVNASTHCRDGIKDFIDAPNDTKRIQIEMIAFYEFLYFYLHMTMRYAFAMMSDVEMDHLRTQLGAFVTAVAVDSYYEHWPDENKRGMAQDFYRNLEIADHQYAECARFDPSDPPEGRFAQTMEKLFKCLGEQISSAIGKEGNFPCAVYVSGIAIPEWSQIDFTQLIEDFKRDSMGLPPPRVYP